LPVKLRRRFEDVKDVELAVRLVQRHNHKAKRRRRVRNFLRALFVIAWLLLLCVLCGVVERVG